MHAMAEKTAFSAFILFGMYILNDFSFVVPIIILMILLSIAW